MMRSGGSLLPNGLLAAACVAAAVMLAPAGASAQEGGPFAPRATVNGQVISNFEFDQRVLFLRALRAPGDPEKEAIRGLIEDRLSRQAAKDAGIALSAEQVSAGMSEFAARANLTAEQFVAALSQEGVAPETFRDFVTSGLLWRELVRARFGGTLSVTEAQVDRAAANTARKTDIKVLVSELVLPAEGEAVAAALDEARRIRDSISSEGGFASAARQYSASPTAARGGRLDWLPLSNLPPALAQQVLALAPGQVSDPFVVPQAVILFQLNNISETDTIAPAEVFVEWAEYVPAEGESAGSVAAETDTCADLNLLARGRGEGALTLREGTMAAIPADIGLALAKLDAGEVTELNRGGRPVIAMLCARQGLVEPPAPPEGEEVAEEAATEAEADAAPALGGLVLQDRNALRSALLNQQGALKADMLMEELRSEAIITEP